MIGDGDWRSLVYLPGNSKEGNVTEKRVALITGGNKGIGREIARQLGRIDHTVWIGARDEARGRKAEQELRGEGMDAHFVQLDVTDEASVHAAVGTIKATTTHLDVLVNNAGIGGDYASPASEERIDDIRAVFEANAFGTIRVTQAFLPMLHKGMMSRIVNVSSGLGSITLTSDYTQPIWGMAAFGYAASKTVVNMFTVKLAKELAASGIKVNAACPGATDTEMADVRTGAGGMTFPGIRTVEQAARVPVRLATLLPMGPTGGFFHDGDILGGGSDPTIAAYPW